MIGFILLHTPPGLRKSGMPLSVEMPAPVKTTVRRRREALRRFGRVMPVSHVAQQTPRRTTLRGRPDFRTSLARCAQRPALSLAQCFEPLP